MMWMGLLTGIKSFVAANWKWLVIGVVLVFAYFKGTALWDDYKAAKAAAEARIEQLSLSKQAAETEAASARSALAEIQRSNEALAEIRAEVDALLEQVNEDHRAREEAFLRNDGTRHDLQKAADRHGEWVGKLATNATNKVMKELEDAINQ